MVSSFLQKPSVRMSPDVTAPHKVEAQDPEEVGTLSARKMQEVPRSKGQTCTEVAHN